MAELRVYVTKGPTRPWEELKPGDFAQPFMGLHAARETVREGRAVALRARISP